MMTKEQSIAQALLTALGIHFTVALTVYLQVMQGPPWLDALYVVVMVGMIFLVLRELVFNSAYWASHIAPEPMPSVNTASMLWQAGALRLALVLCGILLLGKHLDALVGFLKFLVFPSGLRRMVQTAIISGPQMGWTAIKHSLPMILGLVKLSLAVYLLLGAPHWVRLQLRRNQTTMERNSL